MSDQMRKGYRERLAEGDVVYVAEGEGFHGGPDNTLIVKKGTIKQTHYNGHRKRYPLVGLWDDFEQEPACYVGAGFSPRQLFTAQEIARVLRDEQGPIAIDERPLDELLADPVANREVAIALAAETIGRMADDDFRRPHDPEY